MLLRLAALISILVLGISCDDISLGKTDASHQALLDTVVDYNTVDVYPLFLDCNNCDTSEKQNLCFEMELVRRLQRLVATKKIRGFTTKEETLEVEILVNTEGKISITNIDMSEELAKAVPRLDSALIHSVNALPLVVQPSLKRGIPVNSVFTLPVVLSLEPSS